MGNPNHPITSAPDRTQPGWVGIVYCGPGGVVATSRSGAGGGGRGGGAGGSGGAVGDAAAAAFDFGADFLTDVDQLPKPRLLGAGSSSLTSPSPPPAIIPVVSMPTIGGGATAVGPSGKGNASGSFPPFLRAAFHSAT